MVTFSPNLCMRIDSSRMNIAKDLLRILCEWSVSLNKLEVSFNALTQVNY